ncbi:MAG: Asp23/Gls24 family envelope stress response protein [Chlamydiales bacterium]|nr:Asp23/Gls24 family envelope stress response protein [Chlamydiales bacterium]NCF70859.1 Asp23/Gls24 family envelope stress response protein [Chlamydiales bacterium]
MAQNKSASSTKELELPETEYVRDIENKVFQTIALQVISDTEGVSLVEGSLFDNLLGREGMERIKGVQVEQDGKQQSLSVRLEVNINYGIPIPEKASEIQAKISEEITRLTGLHVSSVHVIFKGVSLSDETKRNLGFMPTPQRLVSSTTKDNTDSEYSENLD